MRPSVDKVASLVNISHPFFLEIIKNKTLKKADCLVFNFFTKLKKNRESGSMSDHKHSATCGCANEAKEEGDLDSLYVSLAGSSISLLCSFSDHLSTVLDEPSSLCQVWGGGYEQSLVLA